MTDIEKLSILIAVNLMGWKRGPRAYWLMPVHDPLAKDKVMQLPRASWWPATYLNDAMEALDFRCSRWSTHREWHIFNSEPSRNRLILMDGCGKVWRAEADTLPLAITICLLRSVDTNEAVIASALGDRDYV